MCISLSFVAIHRCVLLLPTVSVLKPLNDLRAAMTAIDECVTYHTVARRNAYLQEVVPLLCIEPFISWRNLQTTQRSEEPLGV